MLEMRPADPEFVEAFQAVQEESTPTSQAAFCRACLGCAQKSEDPTYYADMALIMCGPHHEWVGDFEELTQKSPPYVLANLSRDNLVEVSENGPSPFAEKYRETQRVDEYTQFVQDFWVPKKPGLWAAYCRNWPATTSFNRLDFWKASGILHHYVPVETEYYSASQKIMQVGAFLEALFEPVNRNDVKPQRVPQLYLAQYELFSQFPVLQKECPEYPDLVEGVGASCRTLIFWGPQGSVTPLHFDPTHVLFCQLVGTKRVLLLPPEARDHLSPQGSNQSGLGADFFLREAQGDPWKSWGQLATLHPGDALFVPRGWWHHVISESISLTVCYHFQ